MPVRVIKIETTSPFPVVNFTFILMHRVATIFDTFLLNPRKYCIKFLIANMKRTRDATQVMILALR